MTQQASDRHLELLRTFRRFELASALRLMPRSGAVCEIGGGDGFQASLLAEAGYEVRSFDIEPSPEDVQLHPVHAYDGSTLPLPDESVDVVFSSNVLEHVAALDLLMAEQERILRPGGLAVHILPNHIWRLMTSVTHYPYLVKRAVLGAPTFSHAGAGNRSRSLGDYLARILAAPAHGTGRSALVELYTFSPAAWKKRLSASGLTLEHCSGTGLFYSGNALFAKMPFPWRCWIGSRITSVSTVYSLRKPSRE